MSKPATLVMLSKTPIALPHSMNKKGNLVISSIHVNITLVVTQKSNSYLFALGTGIDGRNGDTRGRSSNKMLLLAMKLIRRLVLMRKLEMFPMGSCV